MGSPWSFRSWLFCSCSAALSGWTFLCYDPINKRICWFWFRRPNGCGTGFFSIHFTWLPRSYHTFWWSYHGSHGHWILALGGYTSPLIFSPWSGKGGKHTSKLGFLASCQSLTNSHSDCSISFRREFGKHIENHFNKHLSEARGRGTHPNMCGVLSWRNCHIHLPIQRILWCVCLVLWINSWDWSSYYRAWY